MHNRVKAPGQSGDARPCTAPGLATSNCSGLPTSLGRSISPAPQPNGQHTASPAFPWEPRGQTPAAGRNAVRGRGGRPPASGRPVCVTPRGAGLLRCWALRRTALSSPPTLRLRTLSPGTEAPLGLEPPVAVPEGSWAPDLRRTGLSGEPGISALIKVLEDSTAHKSRNPACALGCSPGRQHGLSGLSPRPLSGRHETGTTVLGTECQR